MKRRSFVLRLGGVAAVTSVYSLFGLTACGAEGLVGAGAIPEQLQSRLSHLVDAEFEDYALQQDSHALYERLVEKGVVSTLGDYDGKSVANLALVDPVVEYQTFSYTETEMQLYALAFLLNQVPA